MRLLGLLVLALLLTGCGGDPAPEASPDEPEPTPTSAAPSVPAGKRSSPGPAVVPHVDEGVPRRGPLPLPLCVDGVPGFSFDGTVTAIDGGKVTFEVHESFRGDVPATYVVRLGPPTTPGHSEAGPSYSIGTRLLVQGSDGSAWGCGDTVYYDEETAAERRS